MIYADDRAWITAGEAPEYLGSDITPDMVRDWARRGLCRGHRIGREVYYNLDLLTLAEHRTRTSRGGRPRNSALTSTGALQS